MSSYNPYMNNQFYMQDLQAMKDRIDTQMRQLQQSQMQQPLAQQPITQNFQIAPQQNLGELEGKYAENIDEVKNTFVMKTGIFTTKDFSTIWVKDVNGSIRTFKTEEMIELDEKDKEILMLKTQLNDLKEVMSNANAKQSNNANANEPITNSKSARVSNNKQFNAK